ncbi:4-hydroxy-3-methylbut-2-enyl diphosphate reductase [candidate division WOR-3 bacterium 4484_100]|uniref:4-hydroxy-3-methylbut-2-enyl diphosphate reductase n=1 Tax=candidate division WOR-3 bacterium 4484_100 TaxID=1936077 RepID=A0A1V4QGY4_UNCW3|nr:MAG: 4-hydroxy-3-methylbut-2-enyl diphosphate reductase [candidate division WOR-3 bacterium 4484_100]
MKVYRARHGGFCFGVKRAIRLALEAVRKVKPIYSLGPLIHNRLAVEELKKKGIITVNSIRAIKNKRVIIRSHGINPEVLEQLRKKDFEIVDATCPRVRRAQRFVERLINEGYYVVIIGEEDHPEIKGLLGYAQGRGVIFNEQLRIRHRRIGVVPQTTLDVDHFNYAISRILPNATEVKIYNTICHETVLRIKEAKKLARRCDVMIVVGGKNSANTTRLYEVCKRYKPSYHIESAEEISGEWFKDAESVGITAGASTPKIQVDQVVKRLKLLSV